jgi:putative exosortase-associated protein (TIGR04073 family)
MRFRDKLTLLSRVLLVAGIALICMAGVSRAETTQTVEESSPQEVIDGMANKAVRGTANVATGWVELPKQIYLTVRDEGAVKGIFVGPLKGIGMTLVRTFAGAGELLTFFVAYPGFYDPIIEPEYVWEKE